MFNKEKINRKSNLETADSLSAYMNFTCQQNPHVFEVFYEFLNEVRPKRILEIGTSLGGFTQYLHHISEELGVNLELRSYDIYDRYEYQIMREKGIDVRVENIFSNTYKELINFDVVDFIKGDGVTVVLCDGGSKIDEFNILSEHLKVGDIIMAHDYAFDSKTFDDEINKKYWLWHEISESDIKESVEKHNLKPFRQDMFTKAVWVCKIKE